MRLIGHRLSPFTRRVGVSLRLLDMAFEWREIRASAEPETVRQHNPLGRIPILVLNDGASLIDSTAILDWLDEQVGPERALLPAGGDSRRHAQRWIALGLGVAEKVLVIVQEHRRRQTSVFQLDRLHRLRAQIEAGLEALNAEAPAAGWFAGEHPGQADITVACAYRYALVRLPALLRPNGTPRWARLDALSERAEAVPAFAASSLAELEQSETA